MANLYLQEQLETYHAADLYRVRRMQTIEASQMINFSSNDYLGLSKHPELIKTFQKASEKYGVGSGASQLVTGHYDAHHDCEQAFAEFLQRDRALLFGNGYMANLGVIDTFAKVGDAIFQDRHNHASLLDGGRLSKAKSKRYRHSDMDHLKKCLEKSSANHQMIVSDSVFSMQGDIANIPSLVKIAKSYQATLMIDDAHGIGVLGKNGGGALAHFQCSQTAVPLLICPLGKAFGSYGAIVAGPNEYIESLIQFARSYIYTTALPPALAIANIKSLTLVQKETWRRENLQSLIAFFQKQAAERQLPVMNSQTPIQAILIGNAKKSVGISQKLLSKGILAPALRPPTVEKDKSILRITLNAMHTEQQILQLLDALSCIH